VSSLVHDGEAHAVIAQLLDNGAGLPGAQVEKPDRTRTARRRLIYDGVVGEPSPDQRQVEDSEEEQVAAPVVFISYSHDSEEHRERVLELANRLRRMGIDCRLDRFSMSPPRGWPTWMQEQIEQADFILAVCTESYKAKFERKEDAPGLGVAWEGFLTTQLLYESRGRNDRVIPVIFRRDDAQHVPVILRGVNSYLLPDQYPQLYRVLTRQAEVIAEPIGQIVRLPPRRPLDVLSSGAGPVPELGSSALPEPTRKLIQKLEDAQGQKEMRVLAGESTAKVDRKILELRRAIREDGRLKSGDFLGEGRYRLHELLGEGGFGSVWKAYDRKLQQVVAVKVLHPRMENEQTRRERFFRGARLMARLHVRHAPRDTSSR
jgi:hypothetical protein